MSNPKTTKKANIALQEKKTREGLIFNQSKLRDLEKISADNTVAALLTKIDGEIRLSISGKHSNAKISLVEPTGTKISVSIEEFLRVLAAPGRIRQIAKQQEAAGKMDIVQETIANYVSASGIGIKSVNAISSETFGLVKQSLGPVNVVLKNLEVAQVLRKKHPKDPLGEYLLTSLKLILQIQIGGIVALIMGTKTASESHSEALGDTHVPHWSFNRFSKETIAKESTPYSVFFPRKKFKGITCTTSELVDDAFVEANAVLLGNSKLLIGLVCDRDILDELIQLESFLTDTEANEVVFNKHAWHVLPLMETSVDRFLELKAKAVSEIIPDPGANFKKRLAKLGNALLRASLLETSSLKPDVFVCKALLPESKTDFTPSKGNIYEKLRAEPGIQKAVEDYMELDSGKSATMWADLILMELKIPQSKMFSQFVETIAQVKPDKEPWKSLLAPEKSLEVLEKKMVDAKSIQIFAGKLVHKGDEKYPAIDKLRKKIFELLDADSKLETEPERSPVANIPLGKEGTKLVRFMHKNFGDKVSKSIRGFLCGFTSARLQDESVLRLQAAAGQSLTQFLKTEEEDYFSDQSEEDEYSYN